MSLSVQVHRIVKERKERGEYIPLHTHPFFHCIYVIGGLGKVQAGPRVMEARRGCFFELSRRWNMPFSERMPCRAST